MGYGGPIQEDVEGFSAHDLTWTLRMTETLLGWRYGGRRRRSGLEGV